ncbi:unnamed protein product [Boreogadus saida]
MFCTASRIHLRPQRASLSTLHQCHLHPLFSLQRLRLAFQRLYRASHRPRPYHHRQVLEVEQKRDIPLSTTNTTTTTITSTTTSTTTTTTTNTLGASGPLFEVHSRPAAGLSSSQQDTGRHQDGGGGGDASVRVLLLRGPLPRCSDTEMQMVRGAGPGVPSDTLRQSAGSCSLADYKTGNPFNYL